MKLVLAFFSIVLGYQIANAEVTDIKVLCMNTKGEIINDGSGHFRIERESVKIYEAGGFAFMGQTLAVATKRTGGLQAKFEPCSAQVESPNKHALYTCATSSYIEFLNRVLPDDKNACR